MCNIGWLVWRGDERTLGRYANSTGGRRILRRAEGYGKDLLVARGYLMVAGPIVNAEGKSRCTTQDASSPCKVLQHLEELGQDEDVQHRLVACFGEVTNGR